MFGADGGFLASADYGGHPRGPVAPPRAHPEWQGSIPSRHMDRATGVPRGPKKVETWLREGQDGPARMGLGGYMSDFNKRRADDLTLVRGCSSMPSLQTWAEKEIRWRPGRRTVVLEPAPEPWLLADRPPFVQRKGSFVLRHEARGLSPNADPEADRVQAAALRRKQNLRRQQGYLEDQRERSMVRNLEAWEQTHSIGGGGGGGGISDKTQPLARASGGTRSATLLAHAGASRDTSTPATRRQQTPQWMSSDDTRSEFCRQRPSAY